MGLLPARTDRFKAWVSHYLFEPCFTRPGEGHDKGSVEARGKGLKLQHLTPVPRGKSLAEMSSALLSEVEAAWRQRVRQDGRHGSDKGGGGSGGEGGTRGGQRGQRQGRRGAEGGRGGERGVSGG